MICLRVKKPRRGDDEKEKNKSTVENTRGEGEEEHRIFPAESADFKAGLE